MNDEAHKDGGVMLRWAQVILVMVVQVLLMGAVWGSLRYQVEEHERRLDLIEKLEREQYLPRSEFERRYEDMSRRVEENRERVQKIEQERLEELQRRPRGQ